VAILAQTILELVEPGRDPLRGASDQRTVATFDRSLGDGANDAAEAEVRRRRVDRLSLSGRRSVAEAVVRRAEVRAALEGHLDLAPGGVRRRQNGSPVRVRFVHNALLLSKSEPDRVDGDRVAEAGAMARPRRPSRARR
jgi:hypothetical protein